MADMRASADWAASSAAELKVRAGGPWRLVYDGYVPGEEALREALCTTGNGYFATRGAAPESRADGVHYPGTYVNGVFNRLTTQIAGETVENESLVNMPNWLPLTFRVDGGPWFSVDHVELLGYQQELDLRRGVLTRRLRYRDNFGRHTSLTQRRLASMADPHLAALEVTITAEDWAGRVDVRSGLDGDVANTGVIRYRDLASRHLEKADLEEIDATTIGLRTCTSQSRILIVLAARTQVCTGCQPSGARRVVQEGGQIAHEIRAQLTPGQSLVIEKTVSLCTSRDPAISEPGMEARRALGRAGDFRELLRAHTVRLGNLWERMHLSLTGDERASFILNLHIFHLMQTISRNTADMDVGIPARGLHGEAYRGHVFWDELFVFPYLTLTMPELTRSLLRYRHRRLPEARRAARDAGYRGAMFPWQSGSDGREESQTLHLNPLSGRWRRDHSDRQRHINVAIAYNLWSYYQSTADLEFMSSYGAEVLLEIARFWASIARYDRERERYVIEGVVGPDEYHDAYPWASKPGLANNAYTNVMAVWVLCRGLELLDQLPARRCTALQRELGLTPTEVGRWDDISRRMYIPFHGDGIISQFEGYPQLQELNWDSYRARYGSIQRLDRILEAESDTPNRYRASKQADVLMLFYLLSAEELRSLFTRLGYPWDPSLIPRNVDYYTQRTSHGSTLSRVVHSWVLARANRPGSWELFAQALESDIADIQRGTTAEGIHLGAMAGTIDLAARGYTGIEPRGNVLWLNPCLPYHVRALTFSIRYRGHWDITVRIAGGRIQVTVPPSDAPPITIGYQENLISIAPGDTFDASLPERALPCPPGGEP
jgi:trehalose/maltose hydrolase-like predicted phosphorylase